MCFCLMEIKNKIIQLFNEKLFALKDISVPYKAGATRNLS